jgi:CheY-like chemotaxis protein
MDMMRAICWYAPRDIRVETVLARAAPGVTLTRDGHRVEVGDGGTAGLDLARSGQLDIVLVDIGLHNNGWYEVGRQIHALLSPAVQLIAMTGYDQAEDRQRSREGFDATGRGSRS